ncbi:MAG: riboflavin biosynthesis protein RibF [Oscillospiraceae bacterium]|jgi:riboflavin kinase/FMN adenylyltransferase|nr:riboflavin biosynthesis protein RibF [Oscillospiraceae bacterium]
MKRCVALGFFDGVHIGHARLLRSTAAAARSRGVSACALTFDTHPASLLTAPTPLLNTAGERAEMMTELCGIDEVLTLPFDDELMNTPWHGFLENTLAGRYECVFAAAGEDFRFGFRAEGDSALLKTACAELGMGCEIIPTVGLGGMAVSSTYIRTLVLKGDMEEAGRFLGHWHVMSGTVEHGRHFGEPLGFPTANFPVSREVLCPAHGVYASDAVTGGARYAAVTNIGTRPTVAGTDTAVTVETHIPGFSGDLYGKRLRVELKKYLRRERKFADMAALAEQLAKDTALATGYAARL